MPSHRRGIVYVVLKCPTQTGKCCLCYIMSSFSHKDFICFKFSWLWLSLDGFSSRCSFAGLSIRRRRGGFAVIGLRFGRLVMLFLGSARICSAFTRFSSSSSPPRCTAWPMRTWLTSSASDPHVHTSGSKGQTSYSAGDPSSSPTVAYRPYTFAWVS